MTTQNTTPQPIEMTLEEYQQIERDIQLGLRDTTADGVSIKDIQAANEALQEKQFKERVTDPAAAEDLSDVVDPSKVKVIVGTTENGVTVVDTVGQEDSSVSTGNDDAGDQQTTGNGIPEDFPGRKALVAWAEAGNPQFFDADVLKETTAEEFAAIPGIGEATAQKMFEYPW